MGGVAWSNSRVEIRRCPSSCCASLWTQEVEGVGGMKDEDGILVVYY